MSSRRPHRSATSSLGRDGTSTLAASPNKNADSSAAVLWTIEEVAEFLRVPVLTVRWLRQEGRFPPAIKVGRRLVWDQRDIAAWVDDNREAQAGAA